MSAVVIAAPGMPVYTERSPQARHDGWDRYEVLFTGICMTDRYLARHPKHPDIILGHEVVCRDACGHYFCLNNEICCGACEYCRENQGSHCLYMRELGVNENGGFADFIYAPKENMVPFHTRDPRVGILIEPLACALHAVQRINTLLGLHACEHPRVLVQGSGVSGKLLAYLLKTFYPNLSLFLYDIKPEAVRWAEAFANVEILESVPNEMFHLALDCTGSQQGLFDCIRSLRRGGTLLLYGMPPADAALPLNAHELFARELSLAASMAGCSMATFTRARDLLEKNEDFFSTLLGKTVGLTALPEELLNGIPLPGTRTLVNPSR